MDGIRELSVQLLGLWLAIVGIAVAFGVLFVVGNSLGHWRRQRNPPDQGGEPGSRCEPDMILSRVVGHLKHRQRS